MVGTLRLAALTDEVEPLGLGAADQADLLSRVRFAQEKDDDLIKPSRMRRQSIRLQTMGRFWLMAGFVFLMTKDCGMRS